MRATRAIITFSLIIFIGLTVHAQTPVPEIQHFDKDGLSFDYPAKWQLVDQSTPQIQIIQLLLGDGYAELRVRVPREWLKNPQKEAEAKRLIQDRYLDQFTDSLHQAGLRPTRSNATTEIGGGPAEGIRVRAVLDNLPGGMDAYYRVISDRFVQLSQLGAERDMSKSATAWDMIRNSIKVEPPPQAKPSAQPKPQPSPTPAKPNS